MPGFSVPPELQEMIDNPKMMKVVSDGTFHGTKIFNSDGSKFEPLVQSIALEIRAEDGLARMTMVLLNVEVDIDVHEELVEIERPPKFGSVVSVPCADSPET